MLIVIVLLPLIMISTSKREIAWEPLVQPPLCSSYYRVKVSDKTSWRLETDRRCVCTASGRDSYPGGATGNVSGGRPQSPWGTGVMVWSGTQPNRSGTETPSVRDYSSAEPPTDQFVCLSVSHRPGRLQFAVLPAHFSFIIKVRPYWQNTANNCKLFQHWP